MTAALQDLEAVARVLGEVTTEAFARAVLGPDKGARAGRDWCKRHGVPYRRDGKYNWVRIADLRRALEALSPANDSGDEVADAIDAALDGRAGR